MSPLPRAILFDLDDTLISAYGRPRDAWAKVLAEFAGLIAPLSVDEAVDAVQAYATTFWSDTSRHKEWRLRLLDARREIVGGALRATGRYGADGPDIDTVHTIADRFSRLREEEMKPFPGAYECLDRLKELGIRLALVTNGAAETQRAKIVRFALEHRFDHIQIEGEHGFGKPEDRAYRHAMAALGMAPPDTWMVGDNLEWEVAAPQRLGIYAIWFDAYGAGLPPDSSVRPDRIIRALPELLPPIDRN